MYFRGNALNIYYIVGSDVYALTVEREHIFASLPRKSLRERAIMLCNTYVAFRGVLRVCGMLTVILRDENESEARKSMCGRGCLKEKKKKVGISAEDMILNPHNEEISYWNFANPLEKL